MKFGSGLPRTDFQSGAGAKFKVKMQNLFRKEFQVLGFKIKLYELCLFLLLVILYLFTRVYHLTILPVFCDEAIYIRWAQVMKNEPTLRFLPLSDGKQPLFMWLVIPFLKLFRDPLFAGRMVSVFSGLLTMMGLGVLVTLICQCIEVGLLTILLYIMVPFTLFFDRMALADSLLSAFGVWALIFSILLAKFKRLDLAMILGFILGGAMLTKSPAMIFVLMGVIVVLLCHPERSPKVSGRVERSLLRLRFQKRDSSASVGMTRKIVLLIVTSFITFSIYNVLRLGPNFQMIAIRNKDYAFPFSEIIKKPFFPLMNNLKSVLSFYWGYLTPVGVILGILGIVYGIKEIKKLRNLEILVIFAWLFIPIIGQSFVSRAMTSRYLLYSIPLFILFISYGLRVTGLKIREITRSSLTRNGMIALTLIVILIPSVIFDIKLLFNPGKLPLVKEDLGYIEGWTSGWGIKETADYLKSLPREKGIVVGTEGYFGTLPDGLQIYLEGEKDISVVSAGWPVKTIPEALLNAKRSGNMVYLVVNKSRLQIVDTTKLKLIKEYEKPGGDNLLFCEISNF